MTTNLKSIWVNFSRGGRAPCRSRLSIGKFGRAALLRQLRLRSPWVLPCGLSRVKTNGAAVNLAKRRPPPFRKRNPRHNHCPCCHSRNWHWRTRKNSRLNWRELRKECFPISEAVKARCACSQRNSHPGELKMSVQAKRVVAVLILLFVAVTSRAQMKLPRETRNAALRYWL